MYDFGRLFDGELCKVDETRGVIYNCCRCHVDTEGYLVSDWGSCKVPCLTSEFTGCTELLSNHSLIFYTDLIG